ncbi:hypothetical protein [Streptomyces sp. SD15]
MLLLVVCQDRATAKWAAGPFACGARGWTAQRTYPLIVGPDNLPVITDERTAAENLTMAAFSAVAHGRSPRIEAILEALARALQETDGKSADYFNDFLDNSLGKTPAGEKWREILSFVSYFPGRGTVRETAYLEGRAENQASSILRLLERRGIPVPDDARTRITDCSDLDTLVRWFDRAITATRTEDLFSEEPEED